MRPEGPDAPDIPAHEEAAGRLALAESPGEFYAELLELLSGGMRVAAARLHRQDPPPAAEGWRRLRVAHRGPALGSLDVFPGVPPEVEPFLPIILAAAAMALRGLDTAIAANEEKNLYKAALETATMSAEGYVIVGPDGQVEYSDRAPNADATPTPAKGTKVVTAWDPSLPSGGMDVKRRAVIGMPGYTLLLPYDSDKRIERRAKTLGERWGLTRARLRVLALVARGLSNKEIANVLGVAEATVEVHLTAVLRAGGVANRASLIAEFWTRV